MPNGKESVTVSPGPWQLSALLEKDNLSEYDCKIINLFGKLSQILMVISFSSKRLQKICNSEKEMRAKFGPQMADKLKQRLVELHAAETLEDVSRLPPARCHALSQNRAGHLAVDLIHPHRLIFKPDHNSLPTKPDGGLDWAKVTRVSVSEIGDYH